MKRQSGLVLGVLALGALVWFAWASTRPSDAAALRPQDGVAPAKAGSGGGELDSGGAALLHDPDALEARSAQPLEGETSGEATEREPEAPSIEHPLTLRFEEVDREPARPERARVRLASRTGVTRVFESEDQTEVRARLPFGHWRVEVEAEGWRHVPVELDFSSERSFVSVDGELGFLAELALFREDWIPVRLRTTKGEPFTVIAAELGWEPKRVFVEAFAFRASRSPIGPDAEPPSREKTDEESDELMAFEPPDGWQKVCIGEDIIGTVECRGVRPFWLGFWLHGQFFESRVVDADTQELVYVVEADDFLATTAEVSFRLIDRDSEQPVEEGALATLKADVSAHRRHDLQDVAPGAQGRIVFRQVMPGRHDLSIVREGNAILRKLELSPGQRLDLGEIEIGRDAPLVVRVVDAAGAPQLAWIEVAPYVKDAHVDDLYHPNLHRQTGADGRYLLPVQEGKTIVRARPIRDPLGQMYQPEVGTGNQLIDSKAVPNEVVLIVQDPGRVRFRPEAGWAKGHYLEVVDLDLELVIARIERHSQSVSIMPGDYLVRHRAVDDEEEIIEVGARQIRIESGSALLDCP